MSIVAESRPGSRPDRGTVDERRSRALAALRAAELGRPGRRGAAPLPDTSHPASPPASRPPSRPAHPARAVASHPVHPALAGLLPSGTLPRGEVVAVHGSTGLLLGLLAAPSRAGAWTALVGAPAVGLLAAADAGVVLSRTAVVPAPGPDAPTVLAALLDGMDVVVVGPRAALTTTDRRRLAARARTHDAVLVATADWPGAHVVLDARTGTWSGVDAGAGWLRRRTLRVRRTGRGPAARPVEMEVEVPLGGEPPLLPDDAVPAPRRHLRAA